MNADAIIVTCEHASPAVPAEFDTAFSSNPGILLSHRAYDPGAAAIASELAGRIGCDPPVMGTWTRLLIDLNRSLSNPAAFSEFSPPPADPQRQTLIDAYKSYRAGITESVATILNQAPRAIHLSVHTFTPWLAGKQRQADIGLLFDPARPGERSLCLGIRRHLEAAHAYRVRLNYPYRGTSDGFTRTLRHEMGERYCGIELELNHGSYFEDRGSWQAMGESLISATILALAGAPAETLG